MVKEKKFFETRRLVILGMMIAITFILGYTPIGFIMIPPISITIVHIPVIITALLMGPLEGMIVGASMGVISLLRALTSPNALDKLFIDPRVSIFPRILIGVVAYFAFILIKKLLSRILNDNKTVNTISVSFGAVFGSLANTVGVLGMLYLLYAKEFIEEFGVTVKTIVIGAISINIVVEMLVAAIISTPIVMVLSRVVHQKR